MGRYDAQYEAHYAEERARKRKKTAAHREKNKKNYKVELLAIPKFRPKGVCEACGCVVYCVPNWGCRDGDCRYKPPSGES